MCECMLNSFLISSFFCRNCFPDNLVASAFVSVRERIILSMHIYINLNAYINSVCLAKSDILD